MENLPPFFTGLLAWLSLPTQGLTSVFVACFVSATLFSFPSEALVVAVAQLQPTWWWRILMVAAIGNTLGGVVTWWLGYGAKRLSTQVARQLNRTQTETKALVWLERLGAKACFFSWLPIVGDPLCALAGWLKLPFWPCVFYMAVGKFLRYAVLLGALSYWV